MLIFVDCEAWGRAPVTGQLTEFGAVAYPRLDTFHGVVIRTVPDPDNPAVPKRVVMNQDQIDKAELEVFTDFDIWLTSICGKERPVFVSDNVAYDFQWISYCFHRHLGRNPFGHSGRRISDYYAGLRGDWSQTQKWKHLRITKHDHNPVHDALGNAEAFRRLQAGER